MAVDAPPAGPSSPAAPARAVLAAAVLAALLAVAAGWWRSYRRLAHVPGPRWMGVTNLAMARKMYGGRVHLDLLELANKYGPIVRTGPNKVVVSDPDVLRNMSAARSEYVRSSYYKAVRINPHVDNIFSMTDEGPHRVLKSKMGPGYSGRDMGGFEPGIDKHVGALVDLIERRYLSTATQYRPMDLALKCNYFALDVISELGFGAAFGFLREDRDLYDYNAMTRRFFPFVMFMANVPLLLSMLGRWPLSAMGPTAGDGAGFGRLMHFAARFVDGRLAPGAKRGSDMVQSFIDKGLTRDELMQEVFVETVAGSDTTATAVRSTLLCLLGNPAALARLRREIDEGVAAGRVSAPVRDAEARDMAYLQAVIREGLRMFPPATGLLSKLVPAGGDCVLGHRLPAGVEVGHNTFAMLRAPGLFGPDADVFRPERWLEAEAADPDRLRDMVAGLELIFGHGKYQCLGRTIAQTELNKVLVELLRRFDFQIVNVDRPVRLLSAALLIMDELWVRVSRREEAGGGGEADGA